MRPGILSIFIIGICVSGCSSSDTRRSTSPDEASYAGSNADAAAYGMDSAFLGKEQQVRPANDFQFYFKNCTQTDGHNYYSKTSYFCEEK